MLNNKFEYFNNQPSKFYDITYNYYPDQRLGDKKIGTMASGTDPHQHQPDGSADPLAPNMQHYPTYQLIKNQTQLLISVELKEQYYRYSVYFISLMALVSRYLLLSLLVFITRLSYQYDVRGRLPEPAK